MPVELVGAVAAGALVIVAIAVLVLTLSIAALARDARILVSESRQTVAALRAELPSTVASLRDAAVELRALTAAVPERLDRLDDLADEAEATMLVLRSSLQATEDVVRAPLDAVDRARRSLRGFGDSLSGQTEKVRRRAEERSRAER